MILKHINGIKIFINDVKIFIKVNNTENKYFKNIKKIF